MICVDQSFRVVGAVENAATEMQYYVGASGTTAILAFRGAETTAVLKRLGLYAGFWSLYLNYTVLFYLFF